MRQSLLLFKNDLLSFFYVKSFTGEDLCNLLVNVLENVELIVQNVRGQGYDKDANIKCSLLSSKTTFEL